MSRVLAELLEWSLRPEASLTADFAVHIWGELEKNETRIVYESVLLKIIFSEYLSEIEDNKNITITGYLRFKFEGTEEIGVYNEYIIDDDNNEIRLQNIPPEFHKFFIPKQTTKELYNVTGVFKHNLNEIKVDNIINTSRPTKTISKEVKI